MGEGGQPQSPHPSSATSRGPRKVPQQQYSAKQRLWLAACVVRPPRGWTGCLLSWSRTSASVVHLWAHAPAPGSLGPGRDQIRSSTSSRLTLHATAFYSSPLPIGIRGPQTLLTPISQPTAMSGLPGWSLPASPNIMVNTGGLLARGWGEYHQVLTGLPLTSDLPPISVLSWAKLGPSPG